MLFSHHEQTNVTVITLVIWVSFPVCFLFGFVLIWEACFEACSLAFVVCKLYFPLLKVCLGYSGFDPRWGKFSTLGICTDIPFQLLKPRKMWTGELVTFTSYGTERWRKFAYRVEWSRDTVGENEIGIGRQPTTQYPKASIIPHCIHFITLIANYKCLCLFSYKSGCQCYEGRNIVLLITESSAWINAWQVVGTP